MAEERPGKVLTGVDLLKLAQIDNEPKSFTKVSISETTSVPRRKAVPETTKEPVKEPELNREGRYALHSPLLLEDSLGKETTEFLKSVNITTASLLLEVDRESLQKSILDGKLASDEDGAKSVLVTWIGRVRHELKQFEVKKKVSRNSDARGHSRRIIPEELSNPIEALSAITQAFLASMDITSAEDFLSTRTTDIANEFVK